MADHSPLESWRSEQTAAYLSRAVARAEDDPRKRTLFEQMAEAAEEQAAIIAREMDSVPDFHPALRARIVKLLTGWFGPRAMRPALAAIKVRGLSVYRALPGSPGGHPMPTDVESIGRRHRSGQGGALRAGVFGVNDGLVSNTALLMGVAGAGAAPGVIVLTGVAGLLAGAFSMAAGEYVSMRTQREMFEYQIGLEREELEAYPEEEAEELALIYAARGVDLDDARAFARQLIADPERALDTLAREELGLNPDELGSPWGAAISSFMTFSAGAALPVAPFILGAGAAGVPIAAGLTGLALLAVGAVLSLYSGRNALRGGLRMLLIGAGAGVATYAIGSLLGVAAG